MTMLLSGYTFPVLAMPSFFSKITNFMPNTHFIIPIRDISLLGFTYSDVSRHVSWMAKFALIMLALVTLQFVLSKRPKKDKGTNIEKTDSNGEDTIKGISEIDLNDEKLVKFNSKGVKQ